MAVQHLLACSLQGFPEKEIKKLEDYGFIQSRPRGEFHVNNQQMSKLLHKAIGLGGKGNPDGQVCFRLCTKICPAGSQRAARALKPGRR